MVKILVSLVWVLIGCNLLGGNSNHSSSLSIQGTEGDGVGIDCSL